jgi:NADPH-dependent curcumin reductase CurA
MNTHVNRQWRIARRPVGRARAADFEWREDRVPVPRPGQVLIRNELLSLDPTLRPWMRHEDTFLPALELGAVMRGVTVGVVERSRNPALPEGTRVLGMTGWQDFALSDGKEEFLLTLPNDPAISLSMCVGLLGHVGIAAYFGLLDVGRPREGETLVVSAAGGAIGSLVGQIGKLQGCRVIGITGNPEKCRWITEELGFDAAINYKEESTYRRLRELCPDGVDIYFDNVGGALLEDVLNDLRTKARIVVCGMLSCYNDVAGTLTLPAGPNNLLNLMMRRARMEGFVCLDYWSRSPQAFEALLDWYRQGKIKYRVELVEGLHNAPAAMNSLFDGANRGKLAVALP